MKHPAAVSFTGPMNNEDDLMDRTSNAASRSALVRRMRNDVRGALAQYRAARKNMAVDTRSSLRRNRAEIAASVGSIRYERRLTVDRATRSTTNGRPSPIRTPLLPDKIDIGPGCVAGHGSVEQKLLQTIRTHPEGLTMPEIGNEMGVDWRSLVNVAHRLVEDGTIERIEELIYPGSN